MSWAGTRALSEGRDIRVHDSELKGLAPEEVIPISKTLLSLCRARVSATTISPVKVLPSV